jgi:hypothetical protein
MGGGNDNEARDLALDGEGRKRYPDRWRVIRNAAAA